MNAWSLSISSLTIKQPAPPGPNLGFTARMLEFMRDTGGEFIPSVLAKELGVSTMTAASAMRGSFLRGKLRRVEADINGILTYSYSYIYDQQSKGRCAYCGNELTGQQLRFCSKSCNSKINRNKKKEKQ